MNEYGSANREPFSKERFLADIRFTAQLLGAPYREDVTEQMVGLFEDQFREHVVQWKTTDVPGSSLYYRFLSTDRVDHAARVRAAGLLRCSDERVIRLQQTTLDAIPGAMRSGVDFDAEKGLAKVWTYTTPIPAAQALAIPELPAALVSRAALFTELGLEGVGFVASDFIRNTMTMYFGWRASPVTKEWLDVLCSALRCPPVEAHIVEDILASAPLLRGVSVTVDWDQDEIIRCGIYRFGLSYEDVEKRGALPRLSSQLEKLVKLAPSLNVSPCYHLSWSFGLPCNYMKLEKNYVNDVHGFLATERGITL